MLKAYKPRCVYLEMGLLRKWLELTEVLRVGPWPERMSVLIRPENPLSLLLCTVLRKDHRDTQ